MCVRVCVSVCVCGQMPRATTQMCSHTTVHRLDDKSCCVLLLRSGAGKWTDGKIVAYQLSCSSSGAMLKDC